MTFRSCCFFRQTSETFVVIFTGVTLFALVFHLNCTAPSQLSNFFMYIISEENKSKQRHSPVALVGVICVALNVLILALTQLSQWPCLNTVYLFW